MKKGDLATQRIYALKAANALDFQVQKPHISKTNITACKYDSYANLWIFYQTTLNNNL